MKWKPGGEGVRETMEGYIIACVAMGGKDLPPYCYTLSAPKRLIHVVRNVPAEVEAKKEAYRQLQELAEKDLIAQTPQPSTAK